jgi:hypothetical protein
MMPRGAYRRIVVNLLKAFYFFVFTRLILAACDSGVRT